MKVPLRVLLVEDSEHDALLLLRALDKAGFEPQPTRVQTAAAMRSALEDDVWDVILSDYSMPQFTGLDALAIMQDLGLDLPFILISGLVGEELAVGAMKAGAHDYLKKGDLARLGEAVRREIEAAHSRAERRRAEAELRESVVRSRTYIDRAPAAIFIVDDEGRYVDVNPSAERLLGYTKEELLSMTLRDVLPRVRSSEPLAGFLELKETGQLAAKVQLRKKDDSLIPVSLDAVRLSANRYMAFCFDITDAKQLQEQLYQSQKMESVGTLAGGVAHDFNNLLTVILGSCAFLSEGLAPEDNLHEEVEQIRAAGKRGEGLTRQLLAFSRRQTMRPEVLDLSEMVQNLHKMLRRLIREDVDFVTAAGDQLWPVEVDLGQIELVVMNLAVNARDAMPNGGKLTIETANVVLDEEYAASHITAKPGPYVRIAVSDSGVGMDTATLERVYEPFYSTKEDGKGTGLGLSIVYGIVKQSGGNVWIYSEPGEGTTVKVYLPRCEATKQTRAQSAIGTAFPAGGSETVLVVEDDPLVRDLVVRMLTHLGYSVLQACDGVEAVATSRSFAERIDLVLTDIIMPGPNGRQTVEMLLAERPEMAVLFMSGYTDNVIVQHGLLSAEMIFLEKPFSPETLAVKIREALSRVVPS